MVDSVWHESFDRLGVSTPRIKLATIHASKGGESENVVLLTDLAGSTWDELTHNPDTENRTFYVGITRTKQNLHVIQPTTNKYFTIAY